MQARTATLPSPPVDVSSVAGATRHWLSFTPSVTKAMQAEMNAARTFLEAADDDNNNADGHLAGIGRAVLTLRFDVVVAAAPPRQLELSVTGGFSDEPSGAVQCGSRLAGQCFVLSVT